MPIHLQIGGYHIQVEEPDHRSGVAWPLPPFDRFITERPSPPDIHVTVRIVRALPVFSKGPLRFDACHGLWSLFESDSGLLLECLDTRTLEPRIHALVSPDFSTVEAAVLEQTIEGTTGWVPMQVFNPVVELCLVSRVALDGGIVLHAAGVLSSHQGLIFTGPSGAGKSTLAQRFADQGASVLSDERIILRTDGEQIIAYGTPWVGSGRHAMNASGSVTGLYCIRHGAEAHRIETMNPGHIVSAILQQSFLPHWDRPAMNATLAFLGALIQRVPCRRLACLNQPDVVDFLSRQPAVWSPVLS